MNNERHRQINPRARNRSQQFGHQYIPQKLSKIKYVMSIPKPPIPPPHHPSPPSPIIKNTKR
jgi:hypothetical protein